MNIGLEHQENGTYSAPELPESRIPGLLGRRSMKTHRVVLDCFNDKFITIGPGGYQMKLSPGSKVFNLHESEAGHMMLPCAYYKMAGAGNAVQPDKFESHWNVDPATFDPSVRLHVAPESIAPVPAKEVRSSGLKRASSRPPPVDS
jgi:hypothetical protein